MKRIPSVTALLASLAFVATAFLVPDVRYVRVTKVELAGTAGRVVAFVGRLTGQEMETTETVSISGHRMRTDRDRTSSIVDLDAETFTELDHKDRKYTVMTFAEYRAMLQGSAGDAAEGQAAETEDPEVSFELAVDPTNETKELLGQTAKRYFVTLTTHVEPSAEPEDPENPGPPPGDLVMLTDTWLVPELPGRDEEAEFNRLMAQKLWGDDAAQAAAMGMAMSMMNSPQYREGMARLAEEMAKMEGVAVETVTYMITVPDGVEFDRASIIAPPQEKKKSGGLGGLARGLARRAAGQEQQQQDRPPEAPTQQKLLTMSSVTKEASIASIDATFFEVPARYKKVDPERN